MSFAVNQLFTAWPHTQHDMSEYKEIDNKGKDRDLGLLESNKHLWVIRVDDQGTSLKFGSVAIFLDHPDKLRLDRYVTEVRPLLTAKPVGEFMFFTETVCGRRGGIGGRELITTSFISFNSKC